MVYNCQRNVYNYVLDHLKEINEKNKPEMLFVVLEFDKDNFLSAVHYYAAKEISDDKKPETSVSLPLDSYIKKAFSFWPYNIFFSRNNDPGLTHSFYIPLSKKKLEKAIAENLEMDRADLKLDSIGIIPNSAFKLTGTIQYNRIKISKNTTGRLNLLNSQLIDLGGNIFSFSG